VAPIHTPTKREALPEKGRGYANAAIRFMRTKGYLLEDRAEDSGTYRDLKFAKKLSTEIVLAEAKSQEELRVSGFKRSIARYFIKCFKNDYTFYLFAQNLEGDGWETLFEDPDANRDKIEEFFEELQDEYDNKLGDELRKRHIDHFLNFVTNAEIWEYTYGDLLRVADRAERTGEYDDKPYAKSYPPIRKPVELASNLLKVSKLPKTLYRFDTIDEADDAKYYNYNPDRNPVEVDSGYLYSLILPKDLPASTTYYVEDGTLEQLDFRTWVDDANTPEENVAKSLLRRIIGLSARNQDSLTDRTRNGTLLYARYDEDEHGEDRRTYQNKWIAKPLDHRNQIRHRAVWVTVKKFDDHFYYSLKPTDVFTYNGTNRISGELKSDLAASFSDSNWPQNRRKLTTIEMWASLLDPSQTGLQQYMADDQMLATALREMEVSHVTGFKLKVRPPKNRQEQIDIIRGERDPTKPLEDY